MENIEIKYDGEYPNMCSGRLIISENEIIIYNEEFCCYSTGSVWFDEEWNEHVECGELIWAGNEARKFPQYIQEAVKEKLSNFPVCCGGCV